jgi:peptidoglycan/LPS O-acetylase OafA/YrhL
MKTPGDGEAVENIDSEVLMNSGSHNPAGQRRYDVDWLRTLALGLLIIYHIVVTFQPFAAYIAFIQNEQPIEALWVPMMLINVWRIPILFLISGMGVRFAMRRRSWRAFLGDRTKRILLPLMFGTFFIAPIHTYFASIWYEWGEKGIYFPNSGHLWFLGNIYLYVLLLLALFAYFKRRPDNAFLRLTRLIFRQPLGIFVVAIPVVAETLLVRPWSFETYASTAHGFFLGLVLFLTGFIFISVESDFWPAVIRHRFVVLGIAVVLYALRMTYFEQGSPMWLIGIESVSWMLAALGFGAVHLNQPSRTLQYLSAAVYPIYIIHLPVQTALAYFLIPLPLPALFKFFLLVLGTFTV